MKQILISLFVMFMLCTTASAQVKTFQTVTEDETMTVNASDCIDRVGNRASPTASFARNTTTRTIQY